MTPERWQQVKLALDEAMKLTGERRGAYLERIGVADQALRREVESLLAADEQAESRFLRTPAPAALGEVSAEGSFVGSRLGPYELVAEIGSGGMGEVYRARRVDQEYHQEVAIKLVRTGSDPRFVGGRLRTERQILASFEHPNIARLLDGGTIAGGIPYLVMELIDGKPITDYCDDLRLDTTARLRLFVSVCAAVQYAHQRMVIHRDLKPSNILVTTDGVPKLLDFGIAKILEPGVIPDAPDLTINALRILTPEYASPEQLRGEPITAASDVYSLGVVLYELLTGSRPHPVGSEGSIHEVAKVVATHEPSRPSAIVSPRSSGASRLDIELARREAIGAVREGTAEKLSRRLQGDLDNIVLMALRKEPEKRYGSVEQFCADIERHLTGRPVLAHGKQFGYLAGKFIRRHKIELSAAAIILLSLLGGIIATVHQTHLAQRQQARAERNFARVRSLASSLLFELHDSIRELPGATAARRLLVKEALQYLGELSADAATDVGLQRDLAAGYERIGDIQGNPFAANLGDTTGALQSYDKAVKLRQSIYVASSSAADGLNLALGLRLHAAVLGVTGKLQPSRDELRDALRITEAIARSHPTDTQVLQELYREYADLAGVLGGNFDSGNLGDQEQARAVRERQLATAARLVALDPKSTLFRSLQIVAQINVGDQLFAMGRVREAATYFVRSQTPLESLAASSGTVKSSQQLHALYTRLSAVATWTNEPARAVSVDRAALAIAQRLVGDNNDIYARFDLGIDYLNLADALSQAGQLDDARRAIAQALEILSSLRSADPTNSEFGVTYGSALYIEGEIVRRTADHSATLRHFRQALSSYEEMRTKDPNNADARLHVAATLVRIADVQTASGDIAAAREGYLRALDLTGAEGHTAEAHYILTAAYYGLARLESATDSVQTARGPGARKSAACDWLARGDREKASIPEIGANSPNGFYLEISSKENWQRQCLGNTRPHD